MSPHDAAKLLDLPADATPEQIETRFNELRARLEDKVAKAPTPGLKAKYRESLDDITLAFETLTLAADASSLPVRTKQATVSSQASGPANAASPRAGPAPAAKKKSGGKEFLIVAIIAIAAIAGGGWFVMKTRAEAAEKARIATEQKAEAERLAEEKRQAEAAEQKRAAAAAQAEAQRLEKLQLQVRTRLSELNIALDAVLRTEAAAERELTELKAEERSVTREAKGTVTPDLRAAQAQTQAHDRYFTWLRDQLAASPARATRARLEELVSAKAWTEAAADLETYATAIKQLQSDITAKRDELLTLTGSLAVTAEPAEVEFILQDTYGRTRPGRTPAELTDVPLGRATLTFRRTGWPDQTTTVTVARGRTASAAADLVGGALDITTNPAGAAFVLQGQNRKEQGRTPARLAELPLGEYSVTFQREGWPEQQQNVTIKRALTVTAQVTYPAASTIKVTSTPDGAEVWRGARLLGTTPLTLNDLPPGSQQLELRLVGFNPAVVSGDLAPGAQVELKGQLAKKILTKDEAFERFWREADGYWLNPRGGLTRNVNHYVHITAKSTSFQWKMKFLGGSEAVFNLVDYDPASDAIIVAMQGGFMQPSTKSKMWTKDGKLYWGKTSLMDYKEAEELQRCSAAEW